MKILSIREVSVDDIPRTHESKAYRMFDDIVKNKKTYIISKVNMCKRASLYTSWRLYNGCKDMVLTYSYKRSVMTISPAKQVVYA